MPEVTVTICHNQTKKVVIGRMPRDIHDRPMFDRWKEAGFEWTGRGWRPVHPVLRERRRGRVFEETGWYPEMVWWFRQKYNPRKESLRDFIERRKPSHVRFLKKRGWDEESINLVWTEITVSLTRKYSNFADAVEALKKAETRRHRKFKIGGKYYA